MGVPVVGTVMKKVFGTRNERLVKRYLRIVDDVSALESKYSPMTDAELRAKTDEFRKQLEGDVKPMDIMNEVFAVAREAMDRSVGIRNIFNPAQNFDPSLLPDDARALYDETKATMDATEPREPVGDLLGNNAPIPAWQFVDIPVRVYEAVRELYPDSKPPFRARPFDVQIIGAMVLYEGRIAEMKTGEGKTIVAPLATYLAALDNKQVHVVTVNDYLVQRDRDWTFPFFRSLGLTVGAIHPMHEQSPEMKQAAYHCDVVYGTTAEFGFDYLRDNMKLAAQQQVQRRRDFAIVDEVDSTLIDEARTPLIISGPAHENEPRYDMADKLARHLLDAQGTWNAADQKVQSCLVRISGLEGDIRNARDKASVPGLEADLAKAREDLPLLEADRDKHTQFYEVELDKKKATVTHEGIDEAQRIAGVGSFYVGDNIDIPHLLEQAIRAHTVYQRDRDYVVAPDEQGQMSVVIVDQNTGRKMVGRQWSDGLHQAVEAKESVPIKKETQTMATITIQNFYKLYGRLAGMTGTADTEATEFYEIYKLDVVVIPTNVPIARVDHNDVLFMSEKDKWDHIVEEVHSYHDAGRPVLVGTTSVEKSEMLSEMLTRRYSIKHEVLNAKHHEREADIVLSAGQLGAVMIATNMAGRGTDIRLGSFTREQLIDHWKRRSLCPRQVTAEMSDDEILTAVYRHLAQKMADVPKAEAEGMSLDDARLAVARHLWGTYSGDPDKAASMNLSALTKALDEADATQLHRLKIYTSVEDLGGLHVVGTERHESRRIDNQLRGRSGRQGDNGSSRFFLSMEDDLMKMFAGPTTLKLLSKLGLKEGDSIEHSMMNKSVERAQRKVEERNFLQRKYIVEYDEVMDFQRHDHYGARQAILEGRGIRDTIFEYIGDACDDAAYRFLDKNYTANCIGEWVYENLEVRIGPDRIRGKDREDLHKLIRVDAKEDAGNVIELTLGEYMPADTPTDQWDYSSLERWARTRFKADVTVSQLREMSRQEVAATIQTAADQIIDAVDLAPLDQYLVNGHGEKELARWGSNKFGVDISAERFEAIEDPADAVASLLDTAEETYAARERSYPVDFAIDMTTANMQQHQQAQNQQAVQAALAQFCAWAKSRFELDWTPHTLPSPDPNELRKILHEEAGKVDDARIADRAERALVQGSSPDELDAWLQSQGMPPLTAEQRERAEDDPKTVIEERLKELMRIELTQFERWILLQIIDGAWKDHLYTMDQLKESIGFRSFSQRDPRIEYKHEGGRMFEEMKETIRDKLTDLVFKAKLTPQAAARPAAPPEGTPEPRPEAGGGQPAARPAARAAQPAVAAAAAAAQGTPAQRRDLAAAQNAGTPAGARPKRQPRRAAPTVGRNEPCPCGSGKKYKQCCAKAN